MRIAILHDSPAAADVAEGDATHVEAAHVALLDLGHAPIRIAAAAPLAEWTERILDADVDLVLNLCAHGDLPRITATAELLGLRLTGSGSETLFLTRRRDRVSAFLHAAGLPVAASPPLRYAHCFAIGIVGEDVLPIAERERPALQLSDAQRPPRFPPRRLLDAATEVAIQAWRAVEGAGYGKIDVQAAPPSDVAILGVRANPILAPGSTLTRMAAANGWGFTDLVARILDEAANR